MVAIKQNISFKKCKEFEITNKEANIPTRVRHKDGKRHAR